MRKQKQQPVDPDLATWIRLGEGVPLETEVDEGLSEGEKIMRAGNEWAKAQLQSSTWRQSPISPFARRP